MCKVLNPDGTENTNASFIGNRNPFRYRGYYYSEELGLYYLKTRFYDPEVGRFISADTVDYLAPNTVNGLNLYAYCNNNPVMNVDPSGHLVITFGSLLIAMLVGAVVGGAAGAVYGGVTASMSGQNVLAGTIIGFFGGAIMGAATGLATTLMASILSGAAASVTLALKSSTITLGAWTALGEGALLAAGSGALVGAGTEIAGQLINNGSVTNWGAVGRSALQWGLLNLETAFFGALGETSMISAFDRYTTKISSLVWGNIKTGVAVGLLGMLLDYARSQE